MTLWFPSAMRRNSPSATYNPPAPAPPERQQQHRRRAAVPREEESQPAPRSVALRTITRATRATRPAHDDDNADDDTGSSGGDYLEYPRAAAGVSRLLHHLQSSSGKSVMPKTNGVAKPPNDGEDTLFPTAEVAEAEPTALLPPPSHSTPPTQLLPSSYLPDEETEATIAIGDPDRFEWTMTYADLPSLPLFPTSLLSNSATCASLHVRDLPLPTVLARLSDFMRRKSISCDLPLESPGLIRCVTPRHTRFVVLLWKAASGGGGNSNSEGMLHSPSLDGGSNNDNTCKYPPLVVGVERRQGCCVEMRRLRRLLKDAVEGNTTSTFDEAIERCGAEKMIPQFAIGPLVKKLYAQQQQIEVQRSASESGKALPPMADADTFTIATTSTGTSSIASTGGGPRNRRQQRRRSSLEGLSSCASLLRSPCEDRQRLGLESLAALTDPTAGVDPDTAWDAARVLLQLPADDGDDDDEDVDAPVLHHDDGDKDGDECDASSFASLSLPDDFLVYFSRPHEALTRVYPDDDAIESVELAESSRGAVLHSLALEALGHALEVAVHRKPWRQRRRASLSSAVDPSPGGNVPDWDSDFWSTVERALWHDIDRAVSRPHDAALSAKCLSLLEEWRRQDDSVPQEAATSGDPAEALRLRHAHLLPALIRAHRYGAAHHSSLERESRHLLERLTMAPLAVSGVGKGTL